MKYPIKNAVFYRCFTWEDKTGRGKTDARKYKTKSRASRRMKELIDSGQYECVMMRKEEIFFRDETNEFSASSPEEKWER